MILYETREIFAVYTIFLDIKVAPTENFGLGSPMVPRIHTIVLDENLEAPKSSLTYFAPYDFADSLFLRNTSNEFKNKYK